MDPTAAGTQTPPARSRSDPPRVLVIVPAYNEQASLAGVIAELLALPPHIDIAVIDDGSTDHTRPVALEAAGAAGVNGADSARCRVISLPFNLGIGGAMQAGYRYAHAQGYDVAVQVDADGQHPADRVVDLVAMLHEARADLSVGSRFLAPEGPGYDTPMGRRLAIVGIAMLLRLLSGQRFSDPTSGFRAAGRRAIACFAHWYPDDYPEPEVLLLLRRAGLRVVELPVAMRQRQGGVSSIPPIRGLFYVLKVGAALLLDLLREPWPRRLTAR